MITYRQIKVDEIDKFYSLIIDFCEESKADEGALELIKERLDDGRTIVFAAEDDFGVCGVIGYIPVGIRIFSDFFYVMPGMRGKTIGGRLYKVAIDYAKANGAKKSIPIVTEDKEDMYTKLGYRRKYIMLEKEI